MFAGPSCRQDMQDEPKFPPFRSTTFFADGTSARPLVAGTVARGDLRDDELLYTGSINGVPADVFPFPVTLAVLQRGRQRYDIYCSPCHGLVGNGDGMIVQRGFKPPPPYHIERLRQAPAGHYFDVITNGLGAMADYAARVHPRDRWAIIAYIRALQLSQGATLAEVPPEERRKLARMPP